MLINKKIAASVIISALLYYFFLDEFISLTISRQIDIHMILMLVITYYVYLLILIVTRQRIKEKESFAFKFLYGIMLITLFFSKSINSSYVETFNLDISNVVYSLTTRVGLLFLVFNIILIIPLGYMLRKLDFIVKLLLPLFIFLIVEYIQYDNGIGVFDVNDIILNTIGFYIGGFLFYKIRGK